MQRLAQEALHAWDVSPERIELVSVSENLVYRVEAANGTCYALRIHRPGYHTLAELESEVHWIRALAGAGIGVPVAIPTRTGRCYVEVGLAGSGETRCVGLAPWFVGTPLNDHIANAPDERARVEQYQRLGRLMAAMHEQAADWKPPNGFTRHAFDANGLMGDAPFWGRFWEVPHLSPAQRSLLTAARDWLHARLIDYGKSHACSMIHADLHPANVLIAEDQPYAIDFDDAGWGWHVYDLAAALFSEATQPTYEATRDAVVAGYRSARPLAEEDLGRLPEFLLARMLASIGWLNDRPEVPQFGALPHVIEVTCERAEAVMAGAAA